MVCPSSSRVNTTGKAVVISGKMRKLGLLTLYIPTVGVSCNQNKFEYAVDSPRRMFFNWKLTFSLFFKSVDFGSAGSSKTFTATNFAVEALLLITSMERLKGLSLVVVSVSATASINKPLQASIIFRICLLFMAFQWLSSSF